MSTNAATTLLIASPSLASAEVYRITVDEYEAMAEAGILRDPRVELIDGLLVKKMTQKPPHVWTVEAVEDSLARMLPTGWFTRQVKPVRIPDFDEPEPDVSVTRGTRDDYRKRHPEPADLALLVEVADTSLDRDRTEKRFAYGKGRVACYWIVNLVDRQVEVFMNPGPTGYLTSQVFQPGQDVPLAIDGMHVGHVPVNDILP